MSIRRSQDERIEGTPDGVNAITEISDLPDAPSAISATNVGTSRAYNNGAATVSITPKTTGGTPSSYTVTSSPGSFTGSGTSPVTVTGLQSDTSYTFTATATNSTGTSGASSASSSITATTVPQAPTIGTVSATNSTTVSIPFTAGATGGSSITSYTATSSPSISLTTSGTTSPLTITGTFAGAQAYTFTITATNANGTSTASSASNSISPNPVVTAGYVAGGTPNAGSFNNVIRKMPASTEVFTAIGATLSRNVNDPVPLINGSTAGYFAGGYAGGSPSGSKVIDKLTLANDSRSTLGAELSFKKYNCGGVSNIGVAGYVTGGLKDDESGYANITQIDKLNFSTEAKTTLSATVTDGNGYQSCYNVQNPGVAGYILRRDNTTVEKLNFSTEATSLLGNTRTNNTYNAFGFSNGSTSGFIVGGFSTAGQGYPRGGDKLNFSNETWSYISNVLTAVSGGGYGIGGRYNGGSFGFAGSAGYMVGGYAEAYYGHVDKLAFSTDTPSLLGEGASRLGTGINTLVAAKGFSNG